MSLENIAKVCNVAKSTVSTAFNHPQKISKETRDKIYQEALKQGYINKKLKINSIALYYESWEAVFESEFYRYVLMGILEQLEKNNISLKLFSDKSVFDWDELHDQAGIIFFEKAPPEKINKVLQLKLPYMICGYPTLEQEENIIYFDGKRGAYLATEYLISQGHKNIALILGGDPEHDFIPMQRLFGYKKAHAKFFLPVSPKNIFQADYDNLDHLATIIGQITASKPKITAIFCESDLFAYKILSICEKQNIKIPDELSLVGFDGLPLPRIAFQNWPKLTTIKTEIKCLGLDAVTMLLKNIKKEQIYSSNYILPVKLEVNATVKKL
ncbi:LacI family DNA-binding transcriptional regulator [Candidatus Margulisiibacteriota bacterium]